MDALFERMVRLADESGWNPTVLSRPGNKFKTSDEGRPDELPSPCRGDLLNPCGARTGPWVITLENFVSPEEIATLKRWGAKLGYKKLQGGDRVVNIRNTSIAWCSGAFRAGIVASVPSFPPPR